MELLGELFIELLFRRIIIGVFGYYSLLMFYKVTENDRRLEWLNNMVSCRGEEFGKGVLISIVGLIVFSTLFFFIVSIL